MGSSVGSCDGGAEGVRTVGEVLPRLDDAKTGVRVGVRVGVLIARVGVRVGVGMRPIRSGRRFFAGARVTWKRPRVGAKVGPGGGGGRMGVLVPGRRRGRRVGAMLRGRRGVWGWRQEWGGGGERRKRTSENVSRKRKI